MSNKHEKKFIIYLQLGLILTTAGIGIIIYSAFTAEHKMGWIFWAILSAIVINGGLIFLGSSMIHKVKADLIRRQKQKTKTDNALEE